MIRTRHLAIVLFLLLGHIGPFLSQQTPEGAGDPEAAAGEAEPAAEDAKKPKDPFYASPYLPLSRWEYPIREYWVSVGLINSLSPIVKPWRRMDIARALADLDESRLGGGEKGWLARLGE